LQRVKHFPGIIILASNYKNNIDAAFIRRFNAIVPFYTPSATERLQIWKTSVPAKASLADDVDLAWIANKYELNGSSIINIIHYASLQTIARNSTTILKRDILEGIQREYEKDEKMSTE
jgi:ATP-dependent 26S proteasome regulatory subunit